MKLCDFCNSENPTRVYRDKGRGELRLRAFTPTGEVVPDSYQPIMQIGPDHMLGQEWGACDDCGDLIDEGKWGDLKLRVLMAMPMFSDDARELHVRLITELYSGLEKAGMERIK